jgi:hypothetical protein
LETLPNFQIFGNPFSKGQLPAIKGGRGVGETAPEKSVSVGKCGIIISKEMVESLGIGAKDKFTVRKTKAGMALKKFE